MSKFQGFAVYGNHGSTEPGGNYTKERRIVCSDEELVVLQVMVQATSQGAGNWSEVDKYLDELDAKYQEQEETTTVFVVMEAGFEYNDEIYSQAGWENLGDTAFLTVEEARDNAKTRLKALLGNFQLNSFTYEYDEDFTTSVKNWVALADTNFDSATWGQYIDWAEANGVEWVTEVPEFVIIREIKVPSQVSLVSGVEDFDDEEQDL